MKKKIVMLTLAVFSITILLAQNNVDKAYALTVTDVSSGAIARLRYHPATDRYVGIVGGTDSTVTVINPDTKAVTSFILTGINGAEIACLATESFCFTSSGTSTLTRFNPLTGAITSQVIDMASGDFAQLSSFDTSAPRMIGSGNTIFIMASCDSTALKVYVQINSSFEFVSQTGACTSGADLNADSIVGQEISSNKIAFAIIQGANNRFAIWTIGGAQSCTTANLGSVWGSTAGTIVRSGSTWLVTTTSTQRVDIFNDSCTDTGDITSAQHGLDTALHFISANSGRGEVYIQSTTTVAVMNQTSLSSKLYEFSCTSDTARISSAVAGEFDQYACNNSTTTRIVFLGETVETPTTGPIDGFCPTGTLRDCLSSGGALAGLTPPNQNITQVGTTICQGVGICNPNDENPRTNGTGLFLMLITGTFFAIALMSTVHTLNMRGFISASVREIDPIFWLFLVVGTISVAWYLDWIDDIIFFAMTVGLAGLIAFGVLKHFGRI